MIKQEYQTPILIDQILLSASTCPTPKYHNYISKSSVQINYDGEYYYYNSSIKFTPIPMNTYFIRIDAVNQNLCPAKNCQPGPLSVSINLFSETPTITPTHKPTLLDNIFIEYIVLLLFSIALIIAVVLGAIYFIRRYNTCSQQSHEYKKKFH